MKRLVIIALLAIVLVISGCASIEECKKPFISSESGCCLDLDDNSVCDEDEEKEKTEPAKVEVEEKEIVEEKQEAEPAPAVKPETKEEPEPQVQESEEEPETVVVTANKTKAINLPVESETDFEQLMATFAQKVTGYKYVYNANWYYVRGDKIRVKLHDAVPLTKINIGGAYYPLFYYDNAYLNKREKTAFGYCEGTDIKIGKGQCISLKIEDVAYPLSYSHYRTKLPEEWLFEFLDKIPTEVGANKYYVSGRKTTKIVFKENDTESRLYFDLVTGLPVRVEIVRNGNTIDSYTYADLSANTVREEDVIYRKASEIPPTEAFYSIYSAR